MKVATFIFDNLHVELHDEGATVHIINADTGGQISMTRGQLVLVQNAVWLFQPEQPVPERGA